MGDGESRLHCCTCLQTSRTCTEGTVTRDVHTSIHDSARVHTRMVQLTRSVVMSTATSDPTSDTEYTALADSAKHTGPTPHHDAPILLPLEIIHGHFDAPHNHTTPSKSTHSPPTRTSSPSFLSSLSSLRSRASSALATRRQHARYRKTLTAAHAVSVTPTLSMCTLPYSEKATTQHVKGQIEA